VQLAGAACCSEVLAALVSCVRAFLEAFRVNQRRKLISYSAIDDAVKHGATYHISLKLQARALQTLELRH
jgi:hypothetical protein